MAISFDMSNYRADYMISDAAIPQRVDAQISKEQTSQFAQLLKDCSSTEVKMVEVDTPPLSMDNQGFVVENNGYIDISGKDVKEVARMILRGEIDIDDIDPEQITPELLKALVIVAKTEDLSKDDDEDDGEEEEDFFVANGDDASREIDAAMLDQILAILYKFIDAYTDTRYDDETKDAIGGIEELLANFPELSGISEDYGSLEKSGGDSKDAFLAHIMKMRTELAEESEHPINVDMFVKSDELPAEIKTTDTEQSFADEMVNAIGAENVKLLDEAAENGEIGEVSVRQTEQKTPEQEQAPIEIVSQQPVKTDEAADRAKAISEELEMLRNARLNKNAVQPVEEKTTEEKQSTPIQAANPLETESPIVFAGRDGSEITVKPSDVVAQAAKLVETAITESSSEQTEYSLVLNPEELGKITVKLVKATDGAISVTIAAENARTQRILDQNSQLMQSNLRDNGIRLENWQVVRESQQETLAQDYNGSSKNPYYRDDTQQQEEDPDGKSFADIIAAM